MGTPDFAVGSLQALFDDPRHEVPLVVTQQDKPVGRRQILTPPPVKQLALAHGAEVYQPATLKTPEAFERLSALRPDVMVVAAYGKILPKSILDIPRYGCVNLHGSILPRYRGAAPIQWTVINGEKETGVTTMLMNEGIDTGDILLVKTTPVGEDETSGELFDRLAALCPDLLMETLERLEEGSVVPQKQNDADATYAPSLSRELSWIDWNLPAETIHNRIRGLAPWPLALTEVAGKRLKLFSSRKTDEKPQGNGTFFAKKEGLFAVCGDGRVLFLPEVQAEGAKRMTSAEFLRGNKL
jgi:methionyl-tRNA formyltransferase